MDRLLKVVEKLIDEKKTQQSDSSTDSGRAEPPERNFRGKHAEEDGVRLPRFDGGRTEFRSFKKLFLRVAASKRLSDHQKLNLLYSRCTSLIRVHLEVCLDAPDGVGYAQALKILEQRYGSSLDYLTEKAINVMEGGKVRSGNKRELSDLYHLLSGFIAAAEADKSLSNYECPLVVNPIVARFDQMLLNHWQRTYKAHLNANGMSVSSGRVRALKCLRDFLQEEVEAINCITRKTSDDYPELYRSRRDRSRSHTPSRRYSRPAQQNQRESYNTPRSKQPWSVAQTSGRPMVTGAKNRNCPVCHADHILPMCPAFRGMGVPVRKVVVKTSNRCFLCLRPGHASRDCNATKCEVDSCGGLHSRWLHDSKLTNQGPRGAPRTNA